MTWKRDKQQEEPGRVIYWFDNPKIEGGAVASLVDGEDLPDAEIRISYGEEFERITIPVSKSIAGKMSEKEFLRIADMHLKRHGVKIK